MKLNIAIALGALAALSPMQGAHAAALYGSGGDGRLLVQTDSVTGASTTIGAFGYSEVYGLEFDSANTLYALANGYGNGLLTTVNLATGVATAVGQSTGISNLMGMAFAADGTLYAASWTTNSLYILSTQTGAATLVGSLGFGGVMDLAFDNQGTLFGIAGSGLYRINTGTGSGTFVGASGSSCLMGLANAGGSFFATDYCNGSLYSLSTANGGTTFVASTGIASPHGLTAQIAAAVPEPGTWALLILGFGGIGGAMRRRVAVSKTTRMRLTYT